MEREVESEQTPPGETREIPMDDDAQCHGRSGCATKPAGGDERLPMRKDRQQHRRDFRSPHRRLTRGTAGSGTMTFWPATADSVWTVQGSKPSRGAFSRSVCFIDT